MRTPAGAIVLLESPYYPIPPQVFSLILERDALMITEKGYNQVVRS